MFVLTEFSAYKADIIAKSRLRFVERAHTSEGYFKIVVGAVKRENIACIVTYRFVANSFVVKLMRRKTKLLHCLVNGGDADGFVGFFTTEIHDRHFYFNSDIACARFFQRRNKAVVYQFLSVHFLSPYNPEYAI